MYPSAPYVLLIAGLLASVTSGFAFSETLKLSVRTWSENKDTMSLPGIRNLTLLVPFIGVCGGVCVFLASGVQIFAFSARSAYTMSVPLTVVGGFLLWYQLGQLLGQIEKGGSRALELDAF
ncbi:MAG: hypothetical protein F6K09_06430 [Merismopedia sp. SIO2A8]|nr:hypothetical protein [Symploca sp. SIO2B6]NET48355.1 hypothetical protein [Merismopedia sp. SIO2A8]